MTGLWAITSYFNPVRYAARRTNYEVFRDRLGVPLVAVELVHGGAPELGPGDADRLVQVKGGDVLWQKERLLNLALGAVPPDCRAVAWLDCDVVFEDSNWPARTLEVLERVPLAQPFSQVLDLARGAGPDAPGPDAIVLQRESMASKLARGQVDPTRIERSKLRDYSPGHAWAARRDVLERAGFYESMILGSGDLAMAIGAVGGHEALPGPFRMNDRQAEHYLTWARRFHGTVNEQMGVLEGRLFHLWHGELADRGYEDRYGGLVSHSFDPFTDVTPQEGGPLRWSSDKPGLHAYVRQYFRGRREDG